MNAKEQRFAKECALGASIEEAARVVGYKERYAARLAKRPDVYAETVRLREREKTEEARRELKEYLLNVMRGRTGEEDVKIADRVRAAEFLERYFEEESTDGNEVLEVIVDYGDTT